MKFRCRQSHTEEDGMRSTATRTQRERPFNAEEFVALLNRSVFEGKITEVLDELSNKQLEEVASLLQSKQQRPKPKS
jgi:hypothetical protein